MGTTRRPADRTEHAGPGPRLRTRAAGDRAAGPGPRLRRPALVAALAAGALLLTACTTDGDAAGPAPTTTAGGATPSATPVPSDAPSPVTELGLDCAGLLDAATAASVDASWLPRDPYERAAALPADYAIAQEGGLACEWNDGSPTDGKNDPAPGTDDGSGTALSGLRVEVLPHATDDWPRFTEIYGEDTAANCFLPQGSPQASCTSDQLVDETWVSLSLRNFTPPEGAALEEVLDVVRDEVLAAVTSATIVDEPWELGGPLPTWTCVADASLERAVLPGAEDAVVVLPGGGWSLYASAWQRAAASLCTTDPDGGGEVVATESALTGGAWALRQRLEFGHVPADSAVEVPGLPDDAAWRSCDADRCTTDLAIGDDWARLVVPTDAVPDARAASEAYAAAYVERATAASAG